MTKQEKLKAIEHMEQELAKLKQDVEQPIFEWTYPMDKYYLCTEDWTFTNAKGELRHFDHGRFRTTRENAEKSLLRNKRANRLEALVEQIQGNLKGDYCIYQEYKNIWEFGLKNIKQPGVVTMQQETAIKICEMLNNSEFSLEGEL